MVEPKAFDSEYYYAESKTEKIARKSKESPFMVAGLTGCVLACLYGAYMFKRRGRSMSMSNYLMQLRVAAQGSVVACVTLGVGYSLIKGYLDKREGKQITEEK